MDITATLAIIICKVTVHFLHVVMFNCALDNVIFVSLLEGLTGLLCSVNICVLCPKQFVLALCPRFLKIVPRNMGTVTLKVRLGLGQNLNSTN